MEAVGYPGIAPTWTSSAKDTVGCALGRPRLWFTTGYGILNEVYYPRVDIPQIRDLGFIVADGKGFWTEVKRLCNYRIHTPAPGIPAVEIIHEHSRFELHLRIAPDTQRDALLIEVMLQADAGMRTYALLAPHLGGSGHDNRAEVRHYHGRKILWAEQGPFGLALAAVDDAQRDAWKHASAGYVGASDGWQDFKRNNALTWAYDTAGPGNVALIGELPQRATLALAFGTSKESAATLAYGALAKPFSVAWNEHATEWRHWHARLNLPPELPPSIRNQVSISAMVLKVHQDKTYPGAMVASLSIPWGNTRDDIGGYHLVWPRDLVESAGGLLALGALDNARDILRYLIATQHTDGHWSQNLWLGGKAYWRGVQLDETGFPVLLAAALAEHSALESVEVREMVRRALSFIACAGPASDQDRWEENAGINTFTLSVCIAALVCGAEFLDEPARNFALALADYWNASIESWTSASGTNLAKQAGVEAHYIRVAPPGSDRERHSIRLALPIKNRIHDQDLPAAEQVGTDFMQLVRFGLRTADDPLIRASIQVIDHELKASVPAGPVWRRYTGDGYGEHADGSAFNGVGQGRPWPLLTGERGHFELAAGNDPLPYLEAMAAMTGKGGLIPEQIWDDKPNALQNLYPGRPTGSAMPLVWAHAEFIKLAMSRIRGVPLDLPSAVRERYQGRRPESFESFWSLRYPIAEIEAGRLLHICLPEPAVIHWGIDGWQNVSETSTEDTGLGVHVAAFASRNLRRGQLINFTYRWAGSGKWIGHDYSIDVR